jgi:TupA-like ATPgrasp
MATGRPFSVRRPGGIGLWGDRPLGDRREGRKSAIFDTAGTLPRDKTFLARVLQKLWRTVSPLARLVDEGAYDALHMKRFAAERLGRWPNTSTPETFNDHTLANMLAHRRCVLKDFVTDKEFAKIYVRGKCPGLSIPRTFAVLRSEQEILDYDFPAPSMVKPTHTMGGGIAHRAGAIDKAKILRQFRRSYYEISREPHYRRLDHKIIVEELLGQDGSQNGEVPLDWKVHCFLGRPKLVQVTRRQAHESWTRYYTTDWQALPIASTYPLDETIVAEPARLPDLLSYAGAIAEDFDYCRVDAYIIGPEIYFGEITPYHGGAASRWLAPTHVHMSEIDRILGPLFVREDADPQALLARAGLIPG